MNKKILVTYVSETGSTKGVAETIGNVFADGGMDVDVLVMREVGSLAGYDAVVAEALYRGKLGCQRGLLLCKRIRMCCVRNLLRHFWCV